jgi:hypothetical protein
LYKTKENLEMVKSTEDSVHMSSRISALVNGTSKSIGASCNVFSVEDNMESIGEGLAWCSAVLSYQGAPSIDLSKIRPKDSALGTGGTASGSVSFGRMYDSIVSQMRREEKKNGAGILYLDYSHPDLDDFLAEPYKHAYKGVYVPMHDTPEADRLLEDTQLVNKLSKAYDRFECFLVKRPLDINGENMLVNLCTEIEIPHKGYCILGSINLSSFKDNELHLIPEAFKRAIEELVHVENVAMKAASKTKYLGCNSPANRQVGLGVFGLASLLGRLGMTYEEFNDGLYDDLFNIKIKIGSLVYYLREAYAIASKVARKAGLRAAFCIQPTVSTSQRAVDCEGYNVTAEIQPVDGIKTEDGVRLLRKSSIKGDKVETYHPKTWTMDEVPYDDYARTSALFQQLMDSTGLAHRHSHCFYGKEFTTQDFLEFYIGETKYRKSLYYRLSPTNNISSLTKHKLWQNVEEGEISDFDIGDFLLEQQKSNAQKFGSIECECQD